jgi:hypothetical protein
MEDLSSIKKDISPEEACNIISKLPGIVSISII